MLGLAMLWRCVSVSLRIALLVGIVAMWFCSVLLLLEVWAGLPVRVERVCVSDLTRWCWLFGTCGLLWWVGPTVLNFGLVLV